MAGGQHHVQQSGRRRTERSAAQRPASRSVRQAGVGHAQHDGRRSPRSSGMGKGRRVMSAGSASLTVLREERLPFNGRDAGKAGGSTRSAAGHAQDHSDLVSEPAAPASATPAITPTSQAKGTSPGGSTMTSNVCHGAADGQRQQRQWPICRHARASPAATGRISRGCVMWPRWPAGAAESQSVR